MGYEVAYPAITPATCQFGFSDAILQMWAAFLHELQAGEVASRFAQCVTPAESALWHKLFTAALESHAGRRVVAISP